MILQEKATVTTNDNGILYLRQVDGAARCQVPNFLDSYPLSFFRRYHFEN